MTSIAQATQNQERQDPSIPERGRRTIGQICADAMADLVLDGVAQGEDRDGDHHAATDAAAGAGGPVTPTTDVCRSGPGT
ncbi:hypothetical protein RCH12_000253 [Cryobacterium sp. MP_3.1]|uniref:hypothetical protein n=1 Tax=Cryobacterium sp. MP_3.1 TaxID=3071711 RepID=UPI002E0BBDF7|nr:hypothetical protein [Cryobacterium sp. MP_3.1]